MSKTGKSPLPSIGKKEQTNDNKTVDSSFVSNEIRRILNTFKGEKFESNRVETLKCELNFEATSFPTNFIYKKLDIGKNETIIIQDIDKDIDINGFIFTVKLNKEKNCSIINKKNKKIYYTIKEEEGKNNVTIEINGQKLIFYATEEIQIDGIFSIKDFNLDMFDKNEVSSIFTNVDKSKAGSYEIAVAEMKYSSKKATKLISQIIKDSEVMKRMMPDKKVIYLGFFDSDKIDSRVNFKKEFKNIDCVIFGIKNKNCFKRNLTNCIDWNLTKEFKEMKKKVDDEFGEIKEIKEMKKKVDDEFGEIKEIKDKLNKLSDKFYKYLNSIGFVDFDEEQEKEKDKKLEPELLNKKTNRGNFKK